jgi:transcriptional regulator with PAS, ATPase and Fis domain
MTGQGSSPLDVQSRPFPRPADRRGGLHAVLRSLAAELHANRDRLDLAAVLTRLLMELMPVRDIRLTELKSVAALRDAPIRSHDYIAFAVPVADPTRHIVLEASFDPDQGLDGWSTQLLESASRLAALVLEVDRPGASPLQARTSRRDGAAPLVGSSAVMQALRERVERVATTDFTVLIEGESGTGKELVACQVHELSRRRNGPFIAVNCAALVETLIEAELFGIEERTATGVRGRRGKFEHADGGTFFLDEVAELSMAAQAKLLRAIQDLTVERVGGQGGRRVDTRIVAATNRNLSTLVERGLFRADLFYRLSGLEVRVPALRDRKGDILELAQYFLSRCSARHRYSITPAAVDALTTYEWPGNVRELERMIEGAIATAESHQIGLDDLPVSLRGAYGEVLMPAMQTGDTMRAWGSRYARLVLERCNRNKRQTCRVLGITYHTLNAYLEYRPPDVRPAGRIGTSGPLREQSM